MLQNYGHLTDSQRNLTFHPHGVRVEDLGLVAFDHAWEYQTKIHCDLIERKRNGDPFEHHTLILCEHPHVFTLGRSGKEEHLLKSSDEMKAIQAEYYAINRGGDITYHGPGQLVAYPILDLERLFCDVHRYIRSLEQVIIEVLEQYDVESGRIEGLTGVWVDLGSDKPRKICAIGVHLSRWVSLHGLAFNANTNLDYFGYIVPCGIDPKQKPVTSLAKETGKEIDMPELKERFTRQFLKTFQLEFIP